MKEIRGHAKNVRSLLSGAKYGIDYFQREYRWQKEQISELIADLAAKFDESYDERHERAEVENYGHYFLGSIIVSEREGQKFIIDGQQRLTSLTLLLIFLHRKLRDVGEQSLLDELIFSERFGRRSFNLNVPERLACMEALYSGLPFDDADQPESVVNMLGRYQDIEDDFPERLSGNALPYFRDWLIENVHLVEITAYSDADAYTIFETMNDRGLALTATDMLKGYLLANISDVEHRTRTSTVWRARIADLQKLGKEEDAHAIKAWLRSQHATTIRERKSGATPQDFELLGTEFHRWVRDNAETLGHKTSADIARFIERDFAFYGRQYIRIRHAAESLTEGLEAIFYNAQNNFTLQYPVLLAPLRVEDTDADVLRKLRITATFLDILLARRIWNFRAIDYSSMQYAMFLVMREIRGKGVREIAELLTTRLTTETETFASNDHLRLHGTNGRQIHRLLARFTAHLDVATGGTSRYAEYVQRRGKGGYEVEHIWANHPGRHTDEFAHASEFLDYRNRIGGLLLLPKSFNASYGDLPYSEKRNHYLTQNLLAQTLHEGAYERNPGLRRLIDQSGLPLRAHAEFRKADLDTRSILYRKLAERVWDPTVLLQEASG